MIFAVILLSLLSWERETFDLFWEKDRILCFQPLFVNTVYFGEKTPKTHVLFCSLLVTLVKNMRCYRIFFLSLVKQIVNLCWKSKILLFVLVWECENLIRFTVWWYKFDGISFVIDESIFKPYIKTKRTVQVRIKLILSWFDFCQKLTI